MSVEKRQELKLYASFLVIGKTKYGCYSLINFPELPEHFTKLTFFRLKYLCKKTLQTMLVVKFYS